MKDLLLCTLLMQAPVLAQADSTDNQFQLQFPKKDHLTAQQLYDVTDRTGFAKEIRQFVVLDVVVKIARDVPLVEIEKPAALAAGSKIEVLNASVISATTAASSWKTGDRLRIEGIVVGEGYSCYTIYLLNHKESKRPANAVAEPALESDKPSAEDLALVKSFIVTGTVKQAIGSFNGEGNHLDPGASFEFDLSNLPKEKIQFTRPHPNPQERPSSAGYIPFKAPIEIVEVKKSAKGRVGIYLAANDASGKFLIQIVADVPPKPGSWCYVEFYREGIGGFISSSMAEAKGELKVKESVPAAAPVPKDAPPFKPGMKNVEPPIGSLGFKIGSYLTIAGVRAEGLLTDGNQTLLVDTINGHKLDQPVRIWIDGVALPEKERCILKGYETGQWIGVPDEVLRVTGRPPPQAGWQFHFGFSPTSVEQPKNLEIK